MMWREGIEVSCTQLQLPSNSATKVCMYGCQDLDSVLPPQQPTYFCRSSQQADRSGSISKAVSKGDIQANCAQLGSDFQKISENVILSGIFKQFSAINILAQGYFVYELEEMLKQQQRLSLRCVDHMQQIFHNNKSSFVEVRRIN